MGDNQHRASLLCQGEQNLQHLPDHLRVQCRRHFIEQHHLRMHGQRPHNRHPLLLTAGELSGVTVLFLLQPDAGKELHGFFFRLRPGHFSDLHRRQGNVLQNRFMGKQLVALKDHADPLPQPGNILCAAHYRFHIQGDLTSLNRLQPVQAAEKGAFPAAGRTDDHDDFSLLYRKAHILQDSSSVVFLVQMFCAQQNPSVIHSYHPSFHFSSSISARRLTGRQAAKYRTNTTA